MNTYLDTRIKHKKQNWSKGTQYLNNNQLGQDRTWQQCQCRLTTVYVWTAVWFGPWWFPWSSLVLVRPWQQQHSCQTKYQGKCCYCSRFNEQELCQWQVFLQSFQLTKLSQGQDNIHLESKYREFCCNCYKGMILLLIW